MSILAAIDVAAGYGKQEVVRGVSLTAEAGAITCIFGPNGSGKSTLLKAIAGALPLWRGDVLIDGCSLGRPTVHEMVRRGVVMMPQGGGAFARLTVLENLQMGGFTVAAARDVKERIETALNEYPLLKRRVGVAAGSLSGGEQMMLAMARALVSRPRFILLDEPSAGLSPALVSEALDRARALTERGIGILMVEQNIREAMPMANHLYVMAAGEIKFEGTPHDLGSDQEIMNMYMGHQGVPAYATPEQRSFPSSEKTALGAP